MNKNQLLELKKDLEKIRERIVLIKMNPEEIIYADDLRLILSNDITKIKKWISKL